MSKNYSKEQKLFIWLDSGQQWSIVVDMSDSIKLLQLYPVPVMHWRFFAQQVGVDEGVIRGLCEKGHLPIIHFGRHRFINLARLTAECMAEVAD